MPGGVIRQFSAGDGGYKPGGLYTKICIMHFNAQNAVPGLYEGRNGRLQKNFFFQFKVGLYARELYT